MTELVDHLTLPLLRDMFQAMGFRASIVKTPRGEEILQSATAGVAFEGRLGNPSVDGEGQAVDVRFVAAMRVEGALDLGLVNEWNNARRFSRLHLDGETLLLDMDVSVAGGVAPANVAHHIELWNRLVEALVEYFRRSVAGAGQSGGASPAPQPRSDAATSDYDRKAGGQAFEAIIARRWPVPRDVLLSQELYLKAGGYEYAVSMFEDWRLKLRVCYAMAGRWRFAGGVCGTTYDRRLPGLSAGSPIRQIYWQLDAIASVAGLVPDTEPATAVACCNLVGGLQGKLNGLPESFLERFAKAPGGLQLRRALKMFHAAIQFGAGEKEMFRAIYAFLHAAIDVQGALGRKEQQQPVEELVHG